MTKHYKYMLNRKEKKIKMTNSILKKIFSITVEEKEQKFFVKKKKFVVITILGIKFNLANETFVQGYLYFKFLKFIKKNLEAEFIYLQKYLKLPCREGLAPGGGSKHCWSMWWQNNVPEIVQMCLDTIKKIYPNLVVINKDNVAEYVDIPDFIMEKFNSGIIDTPHLSDYIRLCLLEKYGGTWIDATCYLLEPIPDFIREQDFFILQNLDKRGISNYLINASKNNYLVKRLRYCLEQYWENENFTVSYFIFHRFLSLLVSQDLKCKKIYEAIKSDLAERTKLLYYNDYKDFDVDYWNYLKSASFMYKIQRKHKQAVENSNGYYQYLLNEWKTKC